MMLKAIEHELPKLYLEGRKAFRTSLRRYCLKKGRFDEKTVKDFIFDLSCPIGLPRGREEIELFVRHIKNNPSDEITRDVQKNFNNYIAKLIFREFRTEVDVNRFTKK